MFALSVIVFEIFTIEICMTLTSTFRMGQDEMHEYLSKVQYADSFVLAILMFAPTVTVCKIIMFKLPNGLDSNL